MLIMPPWHVPFLHPGSPYNPWYQWTFNCGFSLSTSGTGPSCQGIKATMSILQLMINEKWCKHGPAHSPSRGWRPRCPQLPSGLIPHNGKLLIIFVCCFLSFLDPTDSILKFSDQGSATEVTMLSPHLPGHQGTPIMHSLLESFPVSLPHSFSWNHLTN